MCFQVYQLFHFYKRMYNPILLIFISIVINVQTQQQSDDWYYEMGNDWEVSNKFTTSQNPYYAWYKHAAAQSATYGYATHVGKINRGQLGNPELNMNMPRDRAFGYQSDFYLEDFNSGAFTYKHPGQKFRAKAVSLSASGWGIVDNLVSLGSCL